jgi:hypothetical protein
MHFYGVGELTRKNFFSMLDYAGQISTPKYAALMQYLGAPAPAYAPPPARVTPPIVATPSTPVAPRAPIATVAPRTFSSNRNNITAASRAIPQRGRTQKRNASSLIIGAGINGWRIDKDKAISPPIKLHAGNKNELNLSWRFSWIAPNSGAFFRIYAIDSRGGRKLLLSQTEADIAQVGTNEQLLIEDLNRYIGPPVRLMLQARGLQAIVADVRF